MAIRSKVTCLFVGDDPQKHFLRAMESQLAMSLEMPQLTLFQLTCSMESHLFERPWLEMLLKFKGPVVKDIVVTDDASPRAYALEVLARRNEMAAMLPQGLEPAPSILGYVADGAICGEPIECDVKDDTAPNCRCRSA